LEIIEKLNEVKQQHYKTLFEVCMAAANLLIGTTLFNKKIDTFINKMFKMADGFLLEFNKTSADKLSRNYINQTYEAYRKKKELQGTQQAAAA
jgi:hypothetical protein